MQQEDHVAVRKVKVSSKVAVATRSSPRFTSKDLKDDFKDCSWLLLQ